MKLFVPLFAILLTTNAVADDIQNVSQRMSCQDIQTRISQLSEQDVVQTDTVSEIVRLKAEYRRYCTPSAKGRRTLSLTQDVAMSEEQAKEDSVNINKTDETKEIDNSETDNLATDEIATIEELVVELTLEQELANLDAGLCADGTRPNKFGCCGDEIFKDLGNTVFACCPKNVEDGTLAIDCFPPIK